MDISFFQGYMYEIAKWTFEFKREIKHTFSNKQVKVGVNYNKILKHITLAHPTSQSQDDIKYMH
jgi:hypothetical protein